MLRQSVAFKAYTAAAADRPWAPMNAQLTLGRIGYCEAATWRMRTTSYKQTRCVWQKLHKLTLKAMALVVVTLLAARPTGSNNMQ